MTDFAGIEGFHQAQFSHTWGAQGAALVATIVRLAASSVVLVSVVIGNVRCFLEGQPWNQRQK